jgi:hypothetical protein
MRARSLALGSVFAFSLALGATPEPAGTLPRAELVRVLDAGPGAFLQHVDVQPRFRAGHFYGWRVVSFFPDDPRFAAAPRPRPILPGDVVMRVNGRALERPEQLVQAWQALRAPTVRELVVELERAGVVHALRWAIVD